MKLFNISISIILAAALFVTGCKSGDKKSTPKSEVSVDDTKDANAIIEFNNKFLQLTKSQENLIKVLGDYFTRVNAYVVADHSKSNFDIKPMKPMYVSSGIYKSKEVPTAFGKLRGDMQKNYDTVNASFTIIENGVNEMERYLSAEDYKDDKGAKAKEIQEKVIAAINTYDKAVEQVYTRLKPAADDAEEIILKDHPLKDYILSSKKMLSLADELYDEAGKQYEAEKFDEAPLQQKYDALEAAAKKNAGMTLKTDNPHYKSKEGAFTRLNTQMDSFLGAMRKFMRDQKERGIDFARSTADLNNAYQNLINSYNNFVD